jgi:hypothetical protein
MKNRGELPKYYVKNSHEAIIDRNTFNKVQAEIERRAKASHVKIRPPKHLVFTSLIRCLNCGKAFQRKVAHASNKYRKPVWMCSTFRRFGKSACPARQIPEAILIDLTCKVLELDTDHTPSIDDEWFAAAVSAGVRKILAVDGNTLVFVLYGSDSNDLSQDTQMTVNWNNPSRRNSWTPAMREAARQKTLKHRRKPVTSENTLQGDSL